MLDSILLADVIIDISHSAVDKPYQYRVPERLVDSIAVGKRVIVPFGTGNREITGYCIALGNQSDWPVEKLKEIIDIDDKAVSVEDKAAELALWIKQRYGSTMIAAMQTVLPVRRRIKENTFRTIHRNCDIDELKEQIEKCNPYRQQARRRLLTELIAMDSIPYDMVVDKLNVSASVIKSLENKNLIYIEHTREYRRPVISGGYELHDVTLEEDQREVADAIIHDMDKGNESFSLIHGVTGSGKTEVYMELIDHCIARGQQAIVLIPEIALTFQMLVRFYARYGERVSVIHSKLSDGEKYDQFDKAKKGELDVIIGPRSALFTPFPNTGIIIIDEEHESSYKSEKMPRYDSREVAEHICTCEKAALVLGSATPSVESYYNAINGRYKLYELNRRHGGATLPKVYIADMREELKNGNKTFFSNTLRQLMTERIANGQQIMLFINRRGYAGFMSCRACGYVMKCSHCDVSLVNHMANGKERMVCHYCGYEEDRPKLCPKCGSKYFAGFKAGTQRIEEEIAAMYPSARVLRMDADTAKNKEDYDRILSRFAAREADILVGTQMIVKGHDFPYVTLVGVIAADMSLNAADYRAEERTFQLITQAAGRAGRGKSPGAVVIQTYNPEEYSIRHAMAQDYKAFYEEEILYRTLAQYPPVCHLMAVQFYSRNATLAYNTAKAAADVCRETFDEQRIIGPAPAVISKLNDIYRYVIYVKHEDMRELLGCKDRLEAFYKNENKNVQMQLDFDPKQAF